MDKQIDMYKVKFRCAGWITNSTRYFTASSAGEALKDIDYAMQHNMITCKTIIVKNVSRYNRFAAKWEPQDILTINTKYSTDKRGRILIHKHTEDGEI